MKNRTLMIKTICLVLALLIAVLLAGCGAPQAEEAGNAGEPDAVEERQTEDQPSGEAEPSNGSGTLVVYFSATGNTRGVAERTAELAGADIVEIIPAEPYTDEDLNYSDGTSRATVEQNTPDARPEIAEEISLDGYSTVFLGFPIWWGDAPKIMSTFVESHDFTGITVIPFCTSGSSDIGRSDDALAELAGSGNWLQGRRFPGSVTDDELKAWIDEMGDINMEKSLRLYVDGEEVSVEWEENGSVEALTALAASKPLEVQMSMYGGFEQVGSLGTSLPRNDSSTTTQAGDIVLYSGDQIVLFYGSNSWSYTRLGRISGMTEAEIAEMLGQGDVTITLSLE